jgi:succinate dehydrogenase/fumarate reductase flavoprotein subunit
MASLISSLNAGGLNPYDLVVVGSGFAGSMTTLNFLEECKKLGKRGRVALIEAGQEGERCGASRWTMAYLRLDKDNQFDTDWKNEMHRVSEGLADQEYCKKMEQEVPITAQYLIDHGVKFNHHDEKDVFLEFNTNQHFVFPEGGGHAIINCLFDHIRKHEGVDIMWETQAEKLITTEDGEVCGVKARGKDGKMKTVNGKKVMLACGGFEGNREMLGRYVGPRTEHLELIAPGLKYNTGLGLQMALEVGAATAGSMSGMHCELVDIRAKKPDAVIWGHGFGIVVNEHCKRFYDEGQRHLFATFEMIALETWRDQNQKSYFVTDSVIMDRFRPGWVYDTTDQEPEKSDTIEGLAEKLGLDPKELKKTVDDFNAAINDKEFDLMKLDGKATTGLSPNKTNWANPINKPPFFGYPMKVG